MGVRVKVDRAKKHVQGLEAKIAAFLQGHPYALVMEQEPEARDQIYRIRIRKPIPDCWAGMVGDAIHNLRSALDLLAVALVIANGHTNRGAISETYFPIGADKKFFSTKKIRRASPAAIRIIERLKPYKGGIDDFWRLHQMDILDKHSLLIPVGAAHTSVGIRLRMDVPWAKEQTVFPPIFFRPADTQFPLKDGAEVFRYNVGTGPIPQNDDVQCTFSVAFGEGQIVDGQPLVPTLKQFIDFTERAVNIFARRIFKCAW
jgi:hypothetical protein